MKRLVALPSHTLTLPYGPFAHFVDGGNGLGHLTTAVGLTGLGIMHGITERMRRLAQDPRRLKRALLRRCPGVVAASSFATCRRVAVHGVPHLLKTFVGCREGLAAWQYEMDAREIFAGAPWIAPIVDFGARHILLPFYPPSTRLDVAARNMSESTRQRVAKDAVGILFEIYLRGHAHCDFHSRNLFWVDDRLHVIDFEHMQQYAPGAKPPFRESYDLIGRGLESPQHTENMCYIATPADKSALQSTLGVPLAVALDLFEGALNRTP